MLNPTLIYRICCWDDYNENNDGDNDYDDNDDNEYDRKTWNVNNGKTIVLIMTATG